VIEGPRLEDEDSFMSSEYAKKQSKVSEWRSFVPQRIDWVPGMNPGDISVTIRDAGASDRYVVRQRLHLSDKQFDRYVQFHGYQLNVAIRNARHLVGMMLSKHTPTENLILRYWADPLIRLRDKFTQRLVALVALERPELPSRFDVPAEDQLTQALLSSLGWKVAKIERSHDESGRPRDFDRIHYVCEPFISLSEAGSDVEVRDPGGPSHSPPSRG
jgi:hypothetical protein